MLLRTHAAAITFFDILNRRGDLAKRDYYKDEVLPLSPGYQGSGYVEALGPDVTGVQVGDRVAWALAVSSYASHVIAPAAQLIPVPDDIDLDEAAGLPVQALLAYKLTHEAYPLAEGDWALVQSAAGVWARWSPSSPACAARGSSAWSPPRRRRSWPRRPAPRR